MTKRKLTYFVSYAHRNANLVLDFLEHLEDHLGIHKKYEFETWTDGDITLGERWNEQIQTAMQTCDFGLLLLSASFFNRRYIKEQELPHFIKLINKGKIRIQKPIVPVGLESFDLNSDLQGLEYTQIYRYQKNPGSDYKFYNQLKGQRVEFVQKLVQEMTVKFDVLTNSKMI